MLIRFEVANFRSILEPVELSMVAIDKDRPAARNQSAIPEKLLTVAGIFGPNASGKSNVVAALAWLKEAVRISLRAWDDEIPIQQFAFSGGHIKPTEFALDMTVEGVRYEYLLELNQEEVLYEALFHYPERKRRRVFEREGNDLKLQRGLGSLSGTRDLLTSRALALSIARRFEEPTVGKFARQLLDIQVLGQLAGRRRPVPFGMRSTMAWFEEQSDSDQLDLFQDTSGRLQEDRDQALSLLKLADLGIENVAIDEEDRLIGSSIVNRPRVRLIHKSGRQTLPFDMADESAGTQTWFALIGPALNALKAGSLLLFDELDASLHPILSAQLLDLFRDPLTNPNNAQLVFTSHDTNLLKHANRDEVWLTEKTEEGSTRLGALSDFAGKRVRQSQDLESGYLHGRFGAVPDIDKSLFVRSLGMEED